MVIFHLTILEISRRHALNWRWIELQFMPSNWIGIELNKNSLNRTCLQAFHYPGLIWNLSVEKSTRMGKCWEQLQKSTGKPVKEDDLGNVLELERNADNSCRVENTVNSRNFGISTLTTLQSVYPSFGVRTKFCGKRQLKSNWKKSP